MFGCTRRSKYSIVTNIHQNQYSFIMKNLYLLVVVLLSVSTSLSGQTTWDNFEDVRKGTYGFINGVLIPYTGNPDPTGNTSATVATYSRNAAEAFDVIILDQQTESLADYVAGTKQMSIDVWSPAIGIPIQITMEDSTTALPANFPTGRHSVYLTTTTVAQAWETLTFTYDNRPDGSVPDDAVERLVLLFNPNTNTGDTYYFDNLVGPEIANDTCATAVSDSLTLNDFECNQNVNYTFSHSGTNFRRIENPDASGANTSTHVAQYVRNGGEENDVITGSFAAGFSLGTSSEFKLHVWDASPNTNVVLSLQYDDGTGNLVEVVAMTDSTEAGSQWEELTFEFGDLSTADINTFVILFDPGNFASDTYYFDNFTYTSEPVGIDDLLEVSTFKNYPNPFSGSTTFEYTLKEASQVELNVFDQMGRSVASVYEGTQPAGEQQIEWNSENLPSGVYFYSLQIDGQVATGKMIHTPK